MINNPGIIFLLALSISVVTFAQNSHLSAELGHQQYKQSAKLQSSDQGKLKKDVKYLYLPEVDPKTYLGDTTPSPRIMNYLPLVNNDGDTVTIQAYQPDTNSVKKKYLKKLNYDKLAAQTKVDKLSQFLATEMGQAIVTYFEGLAKGGLNFYKLTEPHFRKWLSIKIISGNDAKMYARTMAQDTELFKEFYINARNMKVEQINGIPAAPQPAIKYSPPVLQSKPNAKAAQNKNNQTGSRKVNSSAQSTTVKSLSADKTKVAVSKKLQVKAKTKDTVKLDNSKPALKTPPIKNSNLKSNQLKTKQAKKLQLNSSQTTTKVNSSPPSIQNKGNPVTKAAFTQPALIKDNKQQTSRKLIKSEKSKQAKLAAASSPKNSSASSFKQANNNTKNSSKINANTQKTPQKPLLGNKQPKVADKLKDKNGSNQKTQKNPAVKALWSNQKKVQYILPKQVKKENKPPKKVQIASKENKLSVATDQTFQQTTLKDSEIYDLTKSFPATYKTSSGPQKATPKNPSGLSNKSVSQKASGKHQNQKTIPLKQLSHK